VNDLLLQKGAAAEANRLATASRDDEKPLVETDSQAVGVGPRSFDHDDDAARVLINEDVSVWRKRAQTSPNDELHQPYNPLP
jgi:hypothetical protein